MADSLSALRTSSGDVDDTRAGTLAGATGTLQSTAVVSAWPDANTLPSGEQARQVISPQLACQCSRHDWVARSHRSIRPNDVPQPSNLPFPANVIEQEVPSAHGRIRSEERRVGKE